MTKVTEKICINYYAPFTNKPVLLVFLPECHEIRLVHNISLILMARVGAKSQMRQTRTSDDCFLSSRLFLKHRNDSLVRNMMITLMPRGPKRVRILH